MSAHGLFEAKHGKQTHGKRKMHTSIQDMSVLKRLQQFRYQKRPAFIINGLEQVKPAGATDLRRRDCPKNPAHRNFVSIDHFSPNHLPPAYYDEDVVECVRALSNLTVHLTVQHQGKGKHCPSDQCPVGDDVDKATCRTTASGLVYKVLNYCNGSEMRGERCPCKECKDSPTPRTQFAHIVVQTALHIIADHLDNALITSHLFFDRGESPDACWGAVTLNNVFRVENIEDKKRCEITYITHDIHLAERLEKMRADWQNLRGIIMSKYLKSSYSPAKSSPLSGNIPDNEQPLVIIVSHPHGCSKHVSIGHCVQRDTLENGLTRYSYSAATCPGSSGARLMIVGKAWWWWYSDHIHEDGADVSWEDNCSGPGSDRFP